MLDEDQEVFLEHLPTKGLTLNFSLPHKCPNGNARNYEKTTPKEEEEFPLGWEMLPEKKAMGIVLLLASVYFNIFQCQSMPKCQMSTLLMRVFTIENIISSYINSAISIYTIPKTTTTWAKLTWDRKCAYIVQTTWRFWNQ